MAKKYRSNNKTQNIITGIIILLLCIVAVFAVLTLASNPETETKNKISELASDYYEDYIYKQLINSDKSKNLEETLAPYQETGLSTVYLRQLLIHNDKNNPETVNYLRARCDENKTSVKFYPESPYSETSYRADFTYSCNFE